MMDKIRVKPAGILCSVEAGNDADAGLRFSACLYQRADEREYGDLVCDYGIVEHSP